MLTGSPAIPIALNASGELLKPGAVKLTVFGVAAAAGVDAAVVAVESAAGGVSVLAQPAARNARTATVFALWNIPPTLARLRLGRLAAETMAAAEAQWLQRFGQMDQRDLRDLRRLRRFVRALLGVDAATRAWQTGARRSLSQAVQAVLVGLPAAPTPPITPDGERRTP